jgi:hypothetical protein
MKRIILALTLCLPLAASSQKTITVSVSNPLNNIRTDQPVVVNLASYGEVRSALVKLDGKEIACQLDDIDQDETYDELCFLADLQANESKNYEVTLSYEGEPRIYPARVYAEMLLRNDKVKQKNKHDNYIESITARGDCANSYNIQHHHGVDFESELNGIRIYFDKRQTLDLYGKFHKRLELKETQFYTQPDQKAEGYGDDVLWVGNTFGLGALRGWNGKEPTMIDPVKSRTQRIISYGPLRTIVEIIDQGWEMPVSKKKVNMTLRYTQYAGHRDTDVDVLFSKPIEGELLSTGIINVKNSEEFSDHQGLRGCWGTDYPSTDTINWKRETVGLGILIPRQHMASEEKANKDNYAFLVKPNEKKLSYKIAYCSDNENFGMHSKFEWFKWLKDWRKEVEKPIVVRIL